MSVTRPHAPRVRRPAGRASAALPAALALLAVLSGCGPSSPAGSYFPLEAGHQWTYRITQEWDNGSTEQERITLRTLGEDSVDVVPAPAVAAADEAERPARPASSASAAEPRDAGRAWRRRSDSGVDYWLRSDATGIYRIATKYDLDPVASADPAPRFVLKMPLAVGTTWQAPTTAYLLRRRSEFPPEIRHSHPSLPMSYAIDALAQTVVTPAGTFKDCIRVKGQATVKLFSDGVQGWRDISLDTREWYCAGVGLVKLERDEPAQSTFLVGGRLKMELISWE